jgi:hypothetical protein
MNISRVLPKLLCRSFVSVVAAIATITYSLSAEAVERPRVYTNQQYIEDVTRKTSVPLDDPKAMLAFILESLPDRVKVYPTENYYYFYFYHEATRYAGNIRLDAKDRDQGKVHFAYFVELTEWQKDDAVRYTLFGKDDGVTVEKIEPLLYRITLGSRSVVFELNDLSKAAPPASALGPHDRYLGPVSDESGIRFFLVFNSELKLFHYILDETVPVADELFPSQMTNRILIARRTGFAFYDEHRLKRKILIGVFEANGSVNNYFDGPFDQLPDNFIKGDELHDAIVAVDPALKGQIDRHGGSPDGASRYLIGPYIYYRTEQDLLPFHQCATDTTIPRELYHACFVVRDDPAAGGEPVADEPASAGDAAEPGPPGGPAPASK